MADRQWEVSLQSLGQPALILDREHRILAVNEAASKATGLSKDRLLGQRCWEVFHGAANPPSGCPVERLRTSGQVESGEMEVEALGRTYMVLCTPLVDAQGSIETIIHVAVDVTEHKKARQALERESAMLEAIFQVSPDAILVADPQGRIVRCNQAVLDLHHFASKDEVVGRPLSMLVASQHRDAMARDLRGHGDAGPGRCVRRTLLTEDCQEFSAEVSFNVLRDAGGQPAATVMVARDITGREQALRESEERYRAVIETTDTGFVAIDEQGRVLMANENYAHLTGHTSVAAILGHQVIEWTAPHDQERNWQEVLRCLERGSVQNLEIDYQRADGTLVQVEVNASVVQTRTGRMIVTLCRDITERKRMEDRIRRLMRTYAVLSDVNQTIVRIREPQALWEKVCSIAIEQGGFRMAWVGLVNESTHKLEIVAHAGATSGVLGRLKGLLDEASSQEPALAALREGSHALCNDLLHDPRMARWRGDALDLGFRSAASFPLVTAGRVQGTISLYGTEPDLFDSDEVKLLDEMAGDVAFAMEFAENEARRRQADEKLRQLALRHETILNEVPDIIVEVDANRIYTWANPAGYAFFGEDMIGKEAAFYFEGEQDTYDRVQPLFDGDASVFYLESWQRRKDGQRRLLAWWCQALKDPDGHVIGALSTARDVTEHHLAQQMLKEREARLQTIFLAAPIGIGVVCDRVFREVNDQFCRMIGYDREEVLEHGTRFLYEGDEEYQRVGDIYSGVSQMRLGGMETRWIRKDGRPIDVLLRLAALKPGDLGAGVTFTALDITERNEAEKALREEESRYRRLLELAGDAILVADAENGTLVEVNRMAEQLLGMSREELLGTPITRLHPPEDAGRYKRLFKWCLDHPGGVLTGDLCVLHKDGHRVPVEICSGVMEWEGRRVVQGIFRDLSERKRAEQALRDSEERFRLAVQGSNDGLWDWPDMEKDYQWWSPRFCELIGYSQDKIEALNSVFNSLVHPDDLEKVMAIARAPREKDEPFDVEFRLKTRSGDYRWFSSRGAVVRSEQGQPVRMCGSLRDITERRKAQAQRATYQARLKSLSSQLALAEERERRRIAVGVHDDIGQKLVLAKLELQSLRQAVSDSAAAQGLDHVCGLIDQSMQDARSLAFELSNPVLYEVGLDAAVESWLTRQVEEKAGIECCFSSELAGAKLEETTSVVLFQAVREVLTNIVKHAKAAHVKASIQKAGSEVRVVIEDDGIGFDPAVLEWSADPQRGVGLFNVQERLEYFNGRLSIRSSPGQGTTVTLAMPFKAAMTYKNQEARSKK